MNISFDASGFLDIPVNHEYPITAIANAANDPAAANANTQLIFSIFLKIKNFFDNNYLISAITNESNATNSANANAIIPGVNISFEASGFLDIPVNHEYPITAIANAANDPAAANANTQLIFSIFLKIKNFFDNQ